MENEFNFFNKYFDESVEYPGIGKIIDPLPLNICWDYVPFCYLDAFINEIKPLKAYLMSRYVKLDTLESDSKMTKREMWDEFNNGKNQYNTKFSHFGDDVVILGAVPDKTKSGQFNESGSMEEFCLIDYGGSYGYTDFDNKKEKIEWDLKVINESNVKNLYYLFYYDSDCSDCTIGRFYTDTPRNKVIEDFEKHYKDLKYDGYSGGYDENLELNVNNFKGWIGW